MELKKKKKRKKGEAGERSLDGCREENFRRFFGRPFGRPNIVRFA